MATISIVIFLLLIVGACMRFGLVKAWQIVLIGALGYYLKDSEWGPWIGEVLGNFFTWVGGLKI